MTEFWEMSQYPSDGEVELDTVTAGGCIQMERYSKTIEILEMAFVDIIDTLLLWSFKVT